VTIQIFEISGDDMLAFKLGDKAVLCSVPAGSVFIKSSVTSTGGIRAMFDVPDCKPSSIINMVCINCRYFDKSCRECDNPKNSNNMDEESKDSFRLRRCGPNFGCVHFDCIDFVK